MRATVSEMGLLLARLMDLNDVQEGVLTSRFAWRTRRDCCWSTWKDLRALLAFVAEHAKELTTQYGNVSKRSVGTIQRQLLVLDNQGGSAFFGEPALALKDFLKVDRDGRGIINMLAADKLMESPRFTRRSCSGSCRSCSRNCPKWAIRQAGAFFDEAHCCSTTPPRR